MTTQSADVVVIGGGVAGLSTAMVGEPVRWTGDKHGFMAELKTRLDALAEAAPPQKWSEDA